MPLTFTTTNATGLSGAYALTSSSSLNRGEGIFTYTYGRFGSTGLPTVGSIVKTAPIKDPDIGQIFSGTTFLKRGVRTSVLGGSESAGAPSAVTFGPAAVTVPGNFGATGTINSASITSIVPYASKAISQMNFGYQTGYTMVPTNVSYAFWS